MTYGSGPYIVSAHGCREEYRFTNAREAAKFARAKARDHGHARLDRDGEDDDEGIAAWAWRGPSDRRIVKVNP